VSPLALLFTLALVAGSPDQVVLENGSVLEGTILSETEDSLEIALSGGGIVSIEKRRAVRIVREPRPGPEAAAPQPEKETEVTWFLALDREGRLIGTRRVVRGPDDWHGRTAFRTEETWRLQSPGGEVLVSDLEWADAQGQPLGFLHREEAPRRSIAIRGEVRGSKLRLERSGPEFKTVTDLVFPRGATFPRLAREGLREKELGSGRTITISVYDPREEAFEGRTFEFPTQRRPPLPGGDAPLFVLAERRGARRSEEWIDAARGTLLYEANGADLVARLCTEAEAASVHLEDLAPEPAADPTPEIGGIPIRSPHPGWARLASPTPGTVFLHERASGSLIAGFELEEPEPTVLVESLWLAFESRLRQSVESYRRTGEPQPTRLDGLPALEFLFEGIGERGRVLGRAVVARAPSGAVAFVVLAPEGAFDFASGDFARIISVAVASN
jgi:hypothetical protein